MVAWMGAEEPSAFLLACCAATVAKGGLWGLIIKYYNPVHARSFGELLVLHQKTRAKKSSWVHLSGLGATVQ